MRGRSGAQRAPANDSARLLWHRSAMAMELPRLDGKTVLVTGATNGIGLEASVALARAGARMVIVGRDAKKTEATVADIKQRAGSQAVESLLCDFASQASVRKLAADYRARYDRLDVLVN